MLDFLLFILFTADWLSQNILTFLPLNLSGHVKRDIIAPIPSSRAIDGVKLSFAKRLVSSHDK